MKKLRGGFTLIEMLIAIAILAILVDCVFMLFITTVRVERRLTRQEEALQQIALLERTWRQDVAAANRKTEGASTLSLEIPDRESSQSTVCHYEVTTGTDKLLSVSRIRLAPSGRISKQLLARGMDVVDFGQVDGFECLNVSCSNGATSRLHPQQLTAIAKLGGKK